MFSGSKQGGAKRPSQSRAAKIDAKGAGSDRDAPSGDDKSINTEVLARHLETQALLRDSSEERMATMIRRTSRLTLTLAGINVLLAATSVFALWTRSDRTPAAMVAPSAPVLAAPKPVIQPVAPMAPPPPAPSPAPSPAFAPPAPAPALPARMSPPRATSPRTPSVKREASVAEAPHRATTRVRTDRQQPRNAEGESLALDSVVERW